MPLLERVLDPATLPAALTELQRLDLIVEEQPAPVPGVPLPARPRAGGRLRQPDRGRPPGAARPGRPGARGACGRGQRAPARWPCSRATSPRPTTPRTAAELPDPRRRRGARDLRRPGGDPPLPRRRASSCGRLGDDRRSRETLFKIALVHHLAFDFGEAEHAYDEAFACKVEPIEQPEATERLVTASLRPAVARARPRVHRRVERDHRAPLPRPAADRPRPERDARRWPRTSASPATASPTCSSCARARAGATASRSPRTTSSTPGSARASCSTVTAFLLEDVERARRSTTARSRCVCASRATTSPTSWPRPTPIPGHATCASAGDDWHRSGRWSRTARSCSRASTTST